MRFIEARENTTVLLTVSKKFAVGLHLVICELIWSKPGMIIDAIELYVLELVFWNKVTQMRESKIFCANYVTKFPIDLDGMWYTVETHWSYEPCAHLIWSDKYSRKGIRNLTCVISGKEGLALTCFLDIFRLIYFKFCVLIETAKLYILMLVWMTLTFMQGYSLVRNQILFFCAHFLTKFSTDLDGISSSSSSWRSQSTRSRPLGR